MLWQNCRNFKYWPGLHCLPRQLKIFILVTNLWIHKGTGPVNPGNGLRIELSHHFWNLIGSWGAKHGFTVTFQASRRPNAKHKKVGHFTHSKQQHHLGMLVFVIFTPFQGVCKEEIRWACQIFISVQNEVRGMDLRWHFKPAGAQMQSTKMWDILNSNKHQHQGRMLVFSNFCSISRNI